MYGVVLWSGRSHKHAVIWCEDHGDLAFLMSDDGAIEYADLAHGDVIAFDLDPGGSFRRVRNARIVDTEVYPLLARSLKDAMARQQGHRGLAQGRLAPCPASSNVVPFTARDAALASIELCRTAR